MIRPDSPTLGFDEWLGRTSPHPILPEPVLAVPEQKTAPAAVLSIPEGSPVPSVDELRFIDPFQQSRSVHRYCTILVDLRRQIATHLTSIEADIAAARKPVLSTVECEEMRKLELRTRIERLRANGWPRRRFDAQRYERLRESALTDLVA